jgi:hypothetical protein
VTYLSQCPFQVRKPESGQSKSHSKSIRTTLESKLNVSKHHVLPIRYIVKNFKFGGPGIYIMVWVLKNPPPPSVILT